MSYSAWMSSKQWIGYKKMRIGKKDIHWTKLLPTLLCVTNKSQAKSIARCIAIGRSPKIPKRPNFRFSPDVWVVPNEKIWASAQKIERGGGPPLSIFFWKTYSKTYLIIVDFDRCRTIRCMVNIVYEVNILALHNYI
jgi:hypothetical protein